MIIGVCPNHEKIRNIMFWSIAFWAEPLIGDTPICDTHKIRYRIGGIDKAWISLISYDIGYSTTQILHVWQDAYTHKAKFICSGISILPSVVIKKILLKGAKPFVRNLCSLFRGPGPQRNNQKNVGSSGCPRHCGSGEIGGISLDVVDQFLVIVETRNKSSSDLQKCLHIFNELWSKRGMNGLCSSGSQMSGSDISIKKPEMLGHFGRKNGQMP